MSKYAPTAGGLAPVLLSPRGDHAASAVYAWPPALTSALGEAPGVMGYRQSRRGPSGVASSSVPSQTEPGRGAGFLVLASPPQLEQSCTGSRHRLREAGGDDGAKSSSRPPDRVDAIVASCFPARVGRTDFPEAEPASTQ